LTNEFIEYFIDNFINKVDLEYLKPIDKMFEQMSDEFIDYVNKNVDFMAE